MVEAFPHWNDEPALKNYLLDLIKDSFIPGTRRFFEIRVETMQGRIGRV